MPSIEVLVSILGGLITLLGIVSTTVWNMIRAETKEQAEQIKKKVDHDRLRESEIRFSRELEVLKADNDKLISKIEGRHERDMDTMEKRLTDKMETLEANLMRQMQLIMELITKQINK